MFRVKISLTLYLQLKSTQNIFSAFGDPIAMIEKVYCRRVCRSLINSNLKKAKPCHSTFHLRRLGLALCRSYSHISGWIQSGTTFRKHMQCELLCRCSRMGDRPCPSHVCSPGTRIKLVQYLDCGRVIRHSSTNLLGTSRIVYQDAVRKRTSKTFANPLNLSAPEHLSMRDVQCHAMSSAMAGLDVSKDRADYICLEELSQNTEAIARDEGRGMEEKDEAQTGAASVNGLSFVHRKGMFAQSGHLMLKNLDHTELEEWCLAMGEYIRLLFPQHTHCPSLHMQQMNIPVLSIQFIILPAMALKAQIL